MNIEFQTQIQKLNIDNDNDIYIKRDDLIPFSFGGNKVRIAYEYFSDMIQQEKNCMIGYGNPRSNLSRALSNMCSLHHIPCHIVSPSDDDGTYAVSSNSMIVSQCEAIVHYCDKSKVSDTISDVINECNSLGYEPYYINGNSFGKGNEKTPVMAYVKAYNEIVSFSKFDYIFLPIGTGMTQSGLIAGCALSNGDEKIVGISIARKKEKSVLAVEAFLKSFFDYEQKYINRCQINIDDNYLFGGYGKYDNKIKSLIISTIKNNGVFFDPTYTGKAFYGMIDYLNKNMIKNKKVLFIHTGGVPLYFDMLYKSNNN